MVELAVHRREPNGRRAEVWPYGGGHADPGNEAAPECQWRAEVGSIRVAEVALPQPPPGGGGTGPMTAAISASSSPARARTSALC